jgi:hypothetical protein
MMGRRLSRAMPPDGTTDECVNCQGLLIFQFGEGWLHLSDGKFQCDWTQPGSSLASPVHWPT